MNWEHVATIAGMVFASTGFWTLVKTIYENKSKKRSHLEMAVLGLLHDRIYELCHECIDRGSITAGQLDNLEHLYLPYHDGLGGNGTGETLYKQAKALPIVRKE